jgi:hypothetical protein
MAPELRQLRAFLAVADQGSASRAGATLFSRAIGRFALDSQARARARRRAVRAARARDAAHAIRSRAARPRAARTSGASARACRSCRSRRRSRRARRRTFRMGDLRPAGVRVRRAYRATPHAVGRGEPRHHAACGERGGPPARTCGRRSVVRAHGARNDTDAGRKRRSDCD